ncbi:MAG TPA: plastocyanin/azurin family copper-binding protein [Gemmatimonadales bacterium]|nr:plastocyanin/azurin family copper-binding protein [Gemmatimonadales bacterium]
MRMRRLPVVAAFAVAAACSGSSTGYGSSPPPPPPAGGHLTSLSVRNNSFSPTPDTVPAGTVTFTWAAQSSGHNVTWVTGPGTLPANSTTMSSGTYQATLQAGTYTYHCTIHAALGMNGTIVVTP